MNEIESLVHEMFRALEQRDGERLDAILDPEVEFIWPDELPGYGGAHRGPEEIAAMAEAFDRLWDPRQPTEDWRRIPMRIVASNGREVVVHYHQRGIDSSGQSCDCEVLALYTVHQGRVRRLQMHYLNPSQVRDFLIGDTD